MSMSRLRRLRLVVTIALIVCAVVSATATVTERLHLQMGILLTTLLTVLAVLSPMVEGWLQQAQSFIHEQDQREEERAKMLAKRARLDVLEQVRRSWVRPELQGSLYKQGRLQLRLVGRPEAVDNPLRKLQYRTDDADHAIATGKHVSDVYRELGKQLLILGEPGAGKTTLLMELTEQLLNEAEQSPSESMPTVFHLSAWTSEDRTLAVWLVDELYKLYGVPRRLGRMWVDTDQLIPLLDGLDEVADKQRESCVDAINAFHDDHGVQPLVVSSRLAEYRTLTAKLRLRAAIEIEPLSRLEVYRYLRHVGRQVSGLRTALRDDEQLAVLLTTPLFLSIVAATYQDKSPTAVRRGGSLEERRHHVLADFTDAMLSRARPSALRTYSRPQTTAWLGWLARTMHAHGESVFYLDWIQPSWLPRPVQRRLVTVGVAASLGAAAAVLVGLFPWIIFAEGFPQLVALLIALLFALPAGLIVGLTAYEPTIEPAEELRWSRVALRRRFPKWMVRGGLVFGSAFGLLSGAIFGLIASTTRLGSGGGLLFALLAALVCAVPAGLVFGLLNGLASGLEPRMYVTRPAPGKAIQRSKHNALVSGLVYCLVVAVVFVLISWLVFWLGAGLLAGRITGKVFVPPTEVTYVESFGPIKVRIALGLLTGLLLGVPTSLVMGSLVGLQRGGGAYLRHWVTRWLLVANGVIPRDYVAFLEYARRIVLLRRRGGGYEFIHRLLLEYFALLDFNLRRTHPPNVESDASTILTRDDAGSRA